MKRVQQDIQYDIHLIPESQKTSQTVTFKMYVIVCKIIRKEEKTQRFQVYRFFVAAF